MSNSLKFNKNPNSNNKTIEAIKSQFYSECYKNNDLTFCWLSFRKLKQEPKQTHGVCVCIGRVPEIICQPTLILTFTALSIMEKKGRGWNRGDVGWWRQTLSLKDARWFSLEVGTRPHQITIPRPALNTELQVNKNQQNNEN